MVPLFVRATHGDHGDRGIGCLGHGVLLVFGAPCQLRLLEHRRTIPLAAIHGMRRGPFTDQAFSCKPVHHWEYSRNPNPGRNLSPDERTEIS
jgi:hypothetical protein